MATPHPQLIQALEKTRDALRDGARYQWSHMGYCNCGYLAQNLTSFQPEEIHRMALAENTGEWSEHARDYCSHSGNSFDLVVDALLAAGLTPKDISHLEYLSDPEVLHALPEGFQHLRRNHVSDVILYLETWLRILRKKMVHSSPASPAPRSELTPC